MDTFPSPGSAGNGAASRHLKAGVGKGPQGQGEAEAGGRKNVRPMPHFPGLDSPSTVMGALELLNMA